MGLTFKMCVPAEPGKPAAAASAARAVSAVAQMTEFIRGSRVDDYEPLFALTAHLGAIVAAGAAAADAAGAAAAAGAGESAVSDARTGDESAGSQSGSPSLPGAALRLVAAVVAGHGKDVGASAGLTAIARAATGWAPLLSHAPINEVCTRAPTVSHLLRSFLAVIHLLGE